MSPLGATTTSEGPSSVSSPSPGMPGLPIARRCPPPTIVIFRDRLRFRIRDIDHVVLVDKDAARAAELRPLGDELAILIENLDAVIRAVSEEQPALRIHGDRMRTVDLARTRALHA